MHFFFFNFNFALLVKRATNLWVGVNEASASITKELNLVLGSCHVDCVVIITV